MVCAIYGWCDEVLGKFVLGSHGGGFGRNDIGWGANEWCDII